MMFHTLRAWRYNEERGVIEMSPHGGIGVLIDPVRQLGDGSYIVSVSYSICEPNMTFNKTRSRERANDQPPRTIRSESLRADTIVEAYISFHYPLINIVEEIENLQRAYSKLRLSKDIALKHRQHHQETIEALKLKERYHDLNER